MEKNRIKKRVGISLSILVLALIAFLVYLLLFYSSPISTSQEFAESLNKCERVSWIREDAQASWLYIIKGSTKGGACKVSVKLLKMKQGTIDTEKLQGEEMICNMLNGETQFPEKNIAQCTGKLKEDLQDIIIQRMHNYLLENVGEIQQEFAGV